MSTFWALALAVVVFLVLRAVFRYITNGGNFGLIPRNITRAYKTIRTAYPTAFGNEAELLFIAASANGYPYIIKDQSIINEFIFAAKENAQWDSDVERLTKFCSMIMISYFMRDSTQSRDEITNAVLSKMRTIAGSVASELAEGKTYPQESIANGIAQLTALNMNYPGWSK